MTRNEQLADVIRLACLTECRDDTEQRALLAVAWDCDRAHNRNTASNGARRRDDWEPQDLVSLVHNTRVVEEDDGQREIPPPKGWAKTWKRWGFELSASGVTK